jgi:glycosyltransferase involved in cell wall biosynthesis
LKSEKKLTIFIPFFNEEKNLKSTVEIIFEAARIHLDQFEILLIDDGSTDHSNDIAAKLTNDKIQLVTLEKNSGFGLAFMHGYNLSQYEFALYLCADGDVTSKELGDLLHNWDGKSNQIQFCQNGRDRNYSRYLLSQVYTKILCVLTKRKIHYFNGFNILSTKNKEQLPLRDFGFSSQAYVMFHALKNNIETKEFGIFCKFNDSGSKSISTKNIFKTLQFLAYAVRNY